jgi:hypothetical protein
MARALLIAGALALPACGAEQPCPEPPACPEPVPVASAAPLNAAAALAAPPGTPLGVWRVSWDRSESGWKPPKFHGVLVVGQEQFALSWEQSSCRPVIQRLEVEGARLEVEYHCEGHEHLSVIKAEVDEGRLWGRMKTLDAKGDGVPWSPLTGTRVVAAQDARLEPGG